MIEGAELGLFAAKEYSEGENITEMGGLLIPVEHIDETNAYMTELSPICGIDYGMLRPQNFALNGEIHYGPGQLGRFANASWIKENCNAEIQTLYKDGSLVVWIVATRRIDANQEIINDYGPLYPWENFLPNPTHAFILSVRRTLHIAFIDWIIHDFPEEALLKELSSLNLQQFSRALDIRREFQENVALFQRLSERVQNCHAVENDTYVPRIVAVANLQPGPIICFAQDRGYTLVADRNYQMGEIITKYGGVLLYQPNAYDTRKSDYIVPVGKRDTKYEKYELDAQDQYFLREKGRWINEPTYDYGPYSSLADYRQYLKNTANVEFVAGDVPCQVDVQATRDIFVGEEFMVYYGPDYLRDYEPPFFWYNLNFKRKGDVPGMADLRRKDRTRDRERLFDNMIKTFANMSLHQLTTYIEDPRAKQLWTDYLWRTRATKIELLE